MASKKRDKTLRKSGEPQFVIRFCEDLNPESDQCPDTPTYYISAGHGWTDCAGDASRMSRGDGVRTLGELLHEEQIRAELVNVTDAYDSPVKIGTVIIHGGRNPGIPQIVTREPTIPGDVLTLTFPDRSGLLGHKRITVDEFIENIRDESYQVLWDPDQMLIPETNDDYLRSIGHGEE